MRRDKPTLTRRAFVSTSAAAAAAAAASLPAIGQAPGTTGTLVLFGLTFSVNERGVADLADREGVSHSGRIQIVAIDANEFDLTTVDDLRISTPELLLSLTTKTGAALKLTRDATGQYRFKPGIPWLNERDVNFQLVQFKDELDLADWQMKAGPLWMTAPAQGAGLEANDRGELCLRIPIGRNLHPAISTSENREWPLSLRSTELVSGRNRHALAQLNIQARTLVLEPRVLRLRATIGHVKPTEGVPSADGFVSFFDSEACELNLGSTEPSITMRFAPRDNRKLLLNAARAPGSDKVATALFASDYSLKLQLVGGRGTSAVRSIVLAPPVGQSHFRLTTTSVVDDQNQAIEWRVAQEVPLKVRPAGRDLPSGFLLAPSEDIKLTLPRATTLHGVISAAKVRRVTSVVIAGAARAADQQWSLVSPMSPPLLPGTPADSALAALDSRIILQIENSNIDKAKPGRSFRSDAAPGVADTWRFESGRALSLAVIPEKLAVETEAYRSCLDALDKWMAASPPMAVLPAKSIHETRIVERLPNGAPSGTLKLEGIYPRSQQAAARASSDEAFNLQAGAVEYLLSPLLLRLTLSADTHRAYIPIYANNLQHESDPNAATLQIQLDRLSKDFAATLTLNAVNAGGSAKPIGVLKLTDEFDLSQILLGDDFSGSKGKGLAHRVHREMRERSWKGLVLFDQKLAMPDSELFRRIIPTKDGRPTIPLEYIAIVPSKKSEGGRPELSIYARIFMDESAAKSESMPDYSSAETVDEDEGGFRLDKLDIEWADSSMERFSADVTIHLRSVFGVRWTGPSERTLAITGYLQRAPRKEVRWIAKLSQPVHILGGESGATAGPIKQALVRGGTIAQVGNDVRVLLDGDLELQKVSFGGSDWLGGSGRLIRFSDLGLSLPGPGLGWRNLQFSYPSLHVDLNMPHFDFLNLEALQIKLTGLGVSWPKASDLDWNDWFSITGKDVKLQRAFYVDFDLSFGRLPELAAKAFKEFKFGLRFGIDISGGRLSDDLWDVRLGALGFRKLNLDLMRFLTITAEKVALEKVPINPPIGTTTEVPLISMSDVSISILDTPIITNLNLAAFTAPDSKRRGFVLSCAGEQEALISSSLLSIHWVIIGRDLVFPQDLARNVLSLDALVKGGVIDSQAAHDDVKRLLKTSFSDAKQMVKSGLSGRARDEWIFGAGFGVLNDFLSGKFLFQDGNVYGLALWGEAFRQWFGEDLAISGTYFKRENAAEDSVVVSAVIPGFNPGPFRFTGGVISFEWAFNGSFLVDIGFPWLDGRGSRQWNRSLGAIVMPFQGSGGTYFRYRKTIAQSSGTKYVQLACGFAVQVGFGATYGSGSAFVVWARIGLYAVIEGEAWFDADKRQLRALHLTGAVGILAEGYGQLEIWIISIRVGVMVSAEARAEIFWIESTQDAETVKRLLCFGPQASGGTLPAKCDRLQPGRVELRLTFELAARAYARACIGPRRFRVCKSFSIQTAISVSKSIYL